MVKLKLTKLFPLAILIFMAMVMIGCSSTTEISRDDEG